MKAVYFFGEEAKITFGDGKQIHAVVREMEIDFFPNKENIAVMSPIMSGQGSKIEFGYQEVNFKASFEVDETLFEFIKPRLMFHQITIQANGFIQEQTKRCFRQLQKDGYLFYLQFRQRIYPKLIHEITFLTTLELKT